MTNYITKQDHLLCAHGLMILHMMFFHLCGSTIYGTPYHNVILAPLSFFMAWFFFKSGMFYKERRLKDVIKYGFVKLIIPAIVFSLIGFVCYVLIEKPKLNFSYETGYLYVFGCLRGNMPIWFLFSLFAVQIIFSLIKKIHIHSLLTAILALGLFCLNKYIGFHPNWTYNIPLGLLFYALGNYLKEYQYNRIIIIICIIIYFGLLFFNKKIDFYYGIFCPSLLTIPWALAGCILTNVLFKSFPRLCITPLRFFGKHAMEFYCTHIIIIAFIEWIIRSNQLFISSILFEFIAFAIYLIVFVLIIHNFNLSRIQWMFGRNSTK